MRNESKIKGITLVALIITIIIMLILAGVSLSMIIGDNGIINKAKSAVNKYQEASEAEQRILNDYYSKIMIATSGGSEINISMKELKSVILEIAYPVGSIYTSKDNKDPATVVGGKWKKLEKGRFLMNADDAHVAGTVVEAGLPNIIASVAVLCNNPNGAFRPYDTVPYSAAGDTNWTANSGFNFDASLSNAIYGRSTTVQPPAYVVNMWERIE